MIQVQLLDKSLMKVKNQHTISVFGYNKYESIYVTGFAKTIPIGTTIEIHFMA